MTVTMTLVDDNTLRRVAPPVNSQSLGAICFASDTPSGPALPPNSRRAPRGNRRGLAWDLRSAGAGILPLLLSSCEGGDGGSGHPVGLIFLSAALLVALSMILPDAWAAGCSFFARRDSENVRVDHRIVGTNRRYRP